MIHEFFNRSQDETRKELLLCDKFFPDQDMVGAERKAFLKCADMVTSQRVHRWNIVLDAIITNFHGVPPSAKEVPFLLEAIDRDYGFRDFYVAYDQWIAGDLRNRPSGWFRPLPGMAGYEENLAGLGGLDGLNMVGTTSVHAECCRS